MADAPRFNGWWGRQEGTRVIVMKRDDWDAVVGSGNEPVNLDISKTQLSGVAQDSTVVVSVAHNFAPATAHVSIFRNDPNDGATPINKDDYEVWIDLQQHPKLGEMIAAASTSDNSNFRDYCAANLFIVKRKPGKDHWLEDLPAPVKALLRKT